MMILFFTVGFGPVFGQEPQSREDWRAFVEIARKSYAERDYQKALLYYQNATLKVPKSIDLSKEIAQTHYRLNQLEESKNWYNKGKVEASSHFNQGNIAFKQKNFQESADLYKKALRKNPNLNEARYNLTKALQELKKNPPPPKPQNSPTPPKKNPNDPEDENDNDSPESGLSDKSIDRILNQLSKSEAETKRKLGQATQKETNSKAKKNW